MSGRSSQGGGGGRDSTNREDGVNEGEYEFIYCNVRGLGSLEKRKELLKLVNEKIP